MGDRVSIQFKRGNLSVVMFSHSDGIRFVEMAKQYVKELKREFMLENFKDNKISYPLSRMDPETMMVDFIRWLYQEKEIKGRIWNNYYLGKDENDGDNSDNGHFIIDVDKIGVADA